MRGSGTGKSYIAQALGNQACLYGKKTFSGITSRIFKRLKRVKLAAPSFGNCCRCVQSTTFLPIASLNIHAILLQSCKIFSESTLILYNISNTTKDVIAI